MLKRCKQTIAQISSENNQIYGKGTFTWKDGKMDSDATFTYVDAVTEFDYDSVQKAAYIKKVQQIKSDKKKNK